MIGRLHDLSVRDKDYAILYAQCASRFPNAVMGIPRPEYRTTSVTTTYSYQAPPPPLPPQTWSTPAAAPTPTANPNAGTAATTFFRSGPCPESCAFCHAPGHRVRTCTAAGEYVDSGRATIINDWIHLPNGQPVPFDGSRRGLQASIDAWLTSQASALTPVQTHAVFTRDVPPHFDSRKASTSRIEEVIESHILQIKDTTAPQDEEEEFSHDIFEVFATEKKKHGAKTSKVPELATPPPATPTPATSSSTLQRKALAAPSLTTPAPANDSNSSRSSSQYRYQSGAED
jgi:hypothetical protein